MSLILTPLVDIPLIQPGDPLAGILHEFALATGLTIQEGDIFVLAQKIVSKAEGRLVNLNNVKPGRKALKVAARVEKDPRFVELVLRESTSVLRERPGTLIVEHRLGFICANAGIDHSNLLGPEGNPEDWVLLLPEDPDSSAACIRAELESLSGVRIGVLIIDSHGRAWRNGVTGTTIGLSGLPAIVDLRGQPDLFGYRLRITTIAAADELAAAASLVMGQANEGRPVVHVRGFPYPLRESSFSEMVRPRSKTFFVERHGMSFSAVVSLLDEETQRKVEAHWDHLEQNCGLKGIRITPFPHLSWQVAESYVIEPLLETLAWRAEHSKPFHIQTAGLGIFSSPEPVLYLQVVKNTPLMEYQQLIWDEAAPYAQGLSPHYHPSAWIPHITLAYRDINLKNIGCVMQEYAFQEFEWLIRLDNLALVAQNGDKVGVLEKRYNFALPEGKT